MGFPLLSFRWLRSDRSGAICGRSARSPARPAPSSSAVPGSGTRRTGPSVVTWVPRSKSPVFGFEHRRLDHFEERQLAADHGGATRCRRSRAAAGSRPHPSRSPARPCTRRRATCRSPAGSPCSRECWCRSPRRRSSAARTTPCPSLAGCSCACASPTLLKEISARILVRGEDDVVLRNAGEIAAELRVGVAHRERRPLGAVERAAERRGQRERRRVDRDRAATRWASCPRFRISSKPFLTNATTRSPFA